MAVTANSIVTPQAVQSAGLQMGATANTNLVTPTNVTSLMAAGPNGGRLVRLEFVAIATQAATQIQVYRHTAVDTGKKLIRAKAFPAYTLTTTSDIPVLDFGYSDDNPLILQPGETLSVGSAVAVTGIAARAEWADY